MKELYELLQSSIPNNHSSQSNAFIEAESLIQNESNLENIVDLGCGEGNSFSFFTNSSFGVQIQQIIPHNLLNIK